MQIDIMTLFPDMMEAYLSESIIGRARKAGFLKIACHNFRDWAPNKWHIVDDTPYGGGMGMLLTPEPIYNCWEALVKDADPRPHTVYLSPKGRVLTQSVVEELARYDRLILLCGHYEGVDQRVLDEIVDEEISCGDYVLTGGELPALILTDAVARLQPGVLAAPECYEDESLSTGLLEYPHYTRPFSFHGKEVPEVLLSGHHGKIDEWRLAESLALTKERRPDLYEKWLAAHPPAPPKKKKKKKKDPPPDGESPAPEEK